MRSRVQVFPFQRAASGPDRPWPTATQAVADGQETALNTLSPGRLGVSWIDQVLPFQRAARVRSRSAWLIRTPTAVQATGRRVGVKVAGGIRTAKDAIRYLVLVRETAGDEWLTPALFRIGASSLLNDLLMQRSKQLTGNYAGPDYFTL